MATQLELNADRFKALCHSVRLAILRLVVQGPEAGTPAGRLQERLGIPASTLSHHLACLSQAELLEVERDGTTLRYRAHFATLRSLTEYLWEGDRDKGVEAEKPERCCGAKVRKAR